LRRGGASRNLICWSYIQASSDGAPVIIRGLAASLVTLALLAHAAAAPTGRDNPAETAPTKPEESPPLHFYLAQGEDDACGSGCNEWIAAEGRFDDEAPQRLRAFLNRHSGRKLPIFFSSPGGLVTQALAIGRLMRERGMTAGVARTVPQGCAPTSDDDACRALKHSGKALAAEWRSLGASCNSSCVYALLGAKLRQVPPGARLGIHSGRLKLTRILTVNGRVKSITEVNSPTQAKAATSDFDARLRRYMRDMGIAAGLLDAAEKIPFEQVRYLSRDEVAGFGIDARAFVESRWTIVKGTSSPPGAFKYFVEAKGPGKSEFRTSVISLTCLNATQFTLGYIHGLASDEIDHLIAIKIAAGGRDLAFSRLGKVSKADTIDTGATFDTRAIRAPADFVTAAAAGESIDITETDLADPALTPRVRRISTAGLGSALEAVRQHCRGLP
jgi:hypothetical protein